VLQQTHSTTAGLSRQDAKHSLSEYGANGLKQKHKSTALILLLNLFKSPILLILIFAAVRSIFLQDVADAIFWDARHYQRVIRVLARGRSLERRRKILGISAS